MSDRDGAVMVPLSEWEAMKSQLAELQRMVGLQHRPGVGVVSEALTDRRHLLKHGAVLAAGAVAGGAALAAARAGPAAAATGDVMHLGDTAMDAGISTTSVTSSASEQTLRAINTSALGSALYGDVTTGQGIAVLAINEGTGPSVFGYISNSASTAEGVHSETKGLGPAISGFVLNSSSTAPATEGTTGGAGPAVKGTSSGTGSAIYGQITNGANNAPAIFGTTSGGGSGVYGQALGGSAAAVYGDATLVPAPGVQGVASDSQGVLGQSGSGPGVSGTSGTGPGVAGQITNTTSTAAAVSGSTTGKGPAVQGTAAVGPGVLGASTLGGIYGVGVEGTQNSGGTGVYGTTVSGNGVSGKATNGAGVRGTAITGRGGIFAGAAAQIQLTPAVAAIHPTPGKTGDLFVDSTARIWFCTIGGSSATWKQVQVA